ncbi:hypothetical protein Dimus_028351 [Dionaea muscipula]
MSRERISSARLAGGWTPVIHRRKFSKEKGNFLTAQGKRDGLFMLFVEDIPEGMDQKDLFRSSNDGVDTRGIKVTDQAQVARKWVPKSNIRPSYARAVTDEKVSDVPTVRGASIGNGWLHRSAVATLCKDRTSEFLIEAFMQQDDGNALVRRQGNHQVLVTFPVMKLMNHFIENHKNGSEWFTSVNPWSVNLDCRFGREVWLSWYGVPVHAWNAREVVQIEDDTVKALRFDIGKVKVLTSHPEVINQRLQLIVGFKSFDIRVAEEQAVLICNTDFRCQCACHTVDISTRGGTSSYPDSRTRSDDNVENLGDRYVLGSSSQQSHGFYGSPIMVHAGDLMEVGLQEEDDQSAMAEEASQVNSGTRRCIDVSDGSKECGALIGGSEVGFGAVIGEKSRSPAVCIPFMSESLQEMNEGTTAGHLEMVPWDHNQKMLRLHGDMSGGLFTVGVVDHSRSNYCLPVSEALGPTHHVDVVPLQVVISLDTGSNRSTRQRMDDFIVDQVDGLGRKDHLDRDNLGITSTTIGSLLANTVSARSIDEQGGLESWRHKEVDGLQRLVIAERDRDSQDQEQNGVHAHTIGVPVLAGDISVPRKRGRPRKKKAIVAAVAKKLGPTSIVGKDSCVSIMGKERDEAEMVWRMGKALGLFSSEKDALVVEKIMGNVADGDMGKDSTI